MSPPARPILLCVDLETGSKTLARRAVEFAKCLGQPLHVLYVESREGDPAAHEWARRHLDALALETLLGVRVESLAIRSGVPEDVIVAYAREYGIDTIIVGHRHNFRHRIHHKISTTHAVIRHSPIPVLVIPLNSPKQNRVE